MARYLLGSQCLVDVAKRVGLAPEIWLTKAGDRGIDARDVYISAVSPMIIEAAFRGAPRTPELQRLRDNVDMLTQRYVAGGLVAPITKNIADLWGKLLVLDTDLTYVNSAGKTELYNFHEKLVFATAIEGISGRPFILVERHQKAHDTLAPLGLVLEDPFQVNS
jgi:hypothetical protein